MATLVLILAVLAAHGAVTGGHMASPAAGTPPMGGGHAMSGGGTMKDIVGSTDGPVGALMAMCLVIAETAALALGARAIAGALAPLLVLISTVRWPACPLVLAPRAAPAPRARPPGLSILQVFRR